MQPVEFSLRGRTLESEISDGVLVVKIAGAQTVDDGEAIHNALGTLSRIAELCEVHRVDRVLLDVNLAGESSSVRVHGVATSLGGINLRRDVNIAIIDRNERSKHHTAFAVRIANSRGWNAELFETETDARAWLRPTG